MLYAMIGLGALIVLLSIIFRVAAAFRLTIPLLYALIVPTLFHTWSQAHPELSNGIWYGLIGLTVLSWIFSFVRKVREWQENRREDRMAEAVMLKRIRDAKAEGRDAVSTEGLFHDDKV